MILFRNCEKGKVFLNNPNYFAYIFNFVYKKARFVALFRGKGLAVHSCTCTCSCSMLHSFAAPRGRWRRWRSCASRGWPPHAPFIMLTTLSHLLRDILLTALKMEPGPCRTWGIVGSAYSPTTDGTAPPIESRSERWASTGVYRTAGWAPCNLIVAIDILLYLKITCKYL